MVKYVLFIEKRRKEFRMKQKDFCVKMGMSTRHWRRMLSGDSVMTVEHLERAKVLLRFRVMLVDEGAIVECGDDRLI